MRKDEFPIIDKHVKNEINAVLDKIRAEILEEMNWHFEHGQEDIAMVLDLGALAIIDKYKAESEDEG